jgi:hypothetical protein
MVDEVLIICNYGIRPMSWNPLGSFSNSQIITLKNINISFKIPLVDSDTFMGFKTSLQVIPIAGTCLRLIINESVELDLRKRRDWFAIWAESMGEDVP